MCALPVADLHNVFHIKELFGVVDLLAALHLLKWRSAHVRTVPPKRDSLGDLRKAKPYLIKFTGTLFHNQIYSNKVGGSERSIL